MLEEEYMHTYNNWHKDINELTCGLSYRVNMDAETELLSKLIWKNKSFIAEEQRDAMLTSAPVVSFSLTFSLFSHKSTLLQAYPEYLPWVRYWHSLGKC